MDLPKIPQRSDAFNDLLKGKKTAAVGEPQQQQKMPVSEKNTSSDPAALPWLDGEVEGLNKNAQNVEPPIRGSYPRVSGS